MPLFLTRFESILPLHDSRRLALRHRRWRRRFTPAFTPDAYDRRVGLLDGPSRGADTSAHIERALVREAREKCANPGCPSVVIEFHHIDDWAVYRSHDQTRMVAICPSCHSAVHGGAFRITSATLIEWKQPHVTGNRALCRCRLLASHATKLRIRPRDLLTCRSARCTEQMFMPPAMTPLTLVTPACSPENEPVPSDIRAVIDLFTTHLAKVSFPDVDATSLGRHADELRAAAKNVVHAREALAAAIAATEARLATLTDAASRALAYARIYGDAHPDRQPIVAALAALSVSARPAASAQTTTSGKRRGRPPKPRESAELFDATPNEAHA